MRIDPAEHETMVAALRPRRSGRPWLPLLNALLSLAGDHACLVSHAERPWASITFSGARHTVVLDFDDGDAADRFIEALAEHEFAIPGKLVADAAITQVDHEIIPVTRVRIEAELLLLDES
jgi:hypothetical protein